MSEGRWVTVRRGAELRPGMQVRPKGPCSGCRQSHVVKLGDRRPHIPHAAGCRGPAFVVVEGNCGGPGIKQWCLGKVIAAGLLERFEGPTPVPVGRLEGPMSIPARSPQEALPGDHQATAGQPGGGKEGQVRLR